MSKSLKSSNSSNTVDSSGFFNKTKITQINIQKLNYGSKINVLLESLIENHNDNTIENSILTSEADEKLKFNNVGYYREDIEEFSSYLSIVEEKIESIDDQIPGSKDKILRAILSHYKSEKKSILISKSIDHTDKNAIINELRKNSDQILKNITEKIIEHAKPNLIETEIETMIELSNIILCYGFVNCKIMENPNDYK